MHPTSCLLGLCVMEEVTIGDATFENAASFTSWDGLLFEIAE
jgi:hypothetical protein